MGLLDNTGEVLAYANPIEDPYPTAEDLANAEDVPAYPDVDPIVLKDTERLKP